MSYWRFAAMIATSTVVMFGLMYLNTYVLEHVLWSETRMWMAFLMGASMAVIMLSYMLSMYQNKGINVGIYAASVVVFGAALWLVRSQATIDQVEYMEAMVPHHSIAIMTSNRAQISDSRVRKLADEIIEAQEREIAEMKYLIAELESNGVGPAGQDAAADIVPAMEAIQSSNIEQSDPESMDEREIRKVVTTDTRCGFSYTLAGAPVLAVGPAPDSENINAVLGLHGRLVELNAQTAGGFQALARNGGVFAADGIRLELIPLPEEDFEEDKGALRRPAELHFELEQGLTVGYRGWYTCRGLR